MIAYFERLRDEAAAEMAESQIDSLFNTICNHAVKQESAETYEFTLDHMNLVEKHVDHILNKVRERFLDEDVVAALTYYATHRLVHVKLENVPLPTQEAQTVKYYWSRAPGKFVNKLTGQPITLNSSLAIGPQFTGTVREWYETLIETIIDVSNEMRRTTGVKATKVFVGRDVGPILECSVLYRPTLKDTTMHAGTLCSRYKVYISEADDGGKKVGVSGNIIRVVADSGTTRHVGLVEVLDMSII